MGVGASVKLTENITSVNLHPLPTAFRLVGWKGHHYCLNGEYLPLDDASKLFNGRPIFKHTPPAGVLGHQKTWQMYWSYGAWRIADKDELPSDQTEKKKECMACVESDASNPTDISASAIWRGATSECYLHFDKDNDKNLEIVEDVRVEKGTVSTACSCACDGCWFSCPFISRSLLSCVHAFALMLSRV